MNGAEELHRSPAIWELSKENIQPLKCGRSLKAVPFELLIDDHRSVALQQEKLSQSECTPLSPIDPLESWYQRIRMAEQLILTGKTSSLRSLVEECIESLQDRSEYWNDRRMLYIWQKLASVSIEIGSLAIYNHMQSHGICTQLADFYIEWASELESTDDFRQANEVLLRGIEENAQPIEKLKSAHIEFLTRAGVPSHQCDGDTEIQRKFSTELTGYGLHKTVPYLRPADGSVYKKLCFANKKPTSFCVFSADSPRGNSFPSNQRALSESAVLNEINVKENVRTPLVWPASKIYHDTSTPAKLDSLLSTPKFNVYEDCTKKVGDAGKDGKSSLKPSKFKIYKHDGMHFVCKPTAFSLNYEMSFEELRAGLTKSSSEN